MSTNDVFSEPTGPSSGASERKRTVTFFLVAVSCVAITALAAFVRRPAAIEEYGKMGQEFYAAFDPTTATSLEVFAYDTKNGVQEFSVQRQDNGRWVIPSHYDYPADAVEKLAKTAASMIGIKRGAMVTRWAADHARYGVVDPDQQQMAVKDLEGAGKRIRLRGEDDATLTDLIIGNKAEDKPGQYFVRKPEEDEVYIADLDIDLSTKFADWINTDLLELDAFDLRHVTLNNYSFDELQGTLTNSVQTTLNRDTGSDPWKMDGLNEETEEVNTDAMRESVNTLADLKVVGVVPKRKGLTPELRVDVKSLSSPVELQVLQQELLSRGFLLQPKEGGARDELSLLGREGELLAASDKGLSYRLYFGRAFAGSQKDLELGLDKASDAKDEADKADDGKQEDKKADDNADKAGVTDEDAAEADKSTEGETETDAPGEKPGRYIFVRVEFDKQYLGDEPVKPVEPEKPAELEEPAEEGEEAKKEEAETEEAKTENADTEGDEPQEDPVEKARQEYEAAKSKYDADLATYQVELDEYNKKVEEGQKKAEEMNRRFAEWYYVIAGESYDKLHLSRRCGQSQRA